MKSNPPPNIFTFNNPLFTEKKGDKKSTASKRTLPDILPERTKYPSTPRPSSPTSSSREKKIPSITLRSTESETQTREEGTFSPRPHPDPTRPRNPRFSTHRLVREQIRRKDGEETINPQNLSLSTIEESVDANDTIPLKEERITLPGNLDAGHLQISTQPSDAPEAETKAFPESSSERPNPVSGTDKVYPEMEDEFFEHSDEFPGENTSSTEFIIPQSTDQGKAKKERIKQLHRARLSNVNPKTAEEVAGTIKYLIEVEASRHIGTVRALRALYCAAGGNIPVDPEQPETRVYVPRLSGLADEQRWEYLSKLLQELQLYLPDGDRRKIGGHLSNLYSNTYIDTANRNGRVIQLDSIKGFIEARLNELQ